MAEFPSTLPAPLAAGYGITPRTQVVRTDMESGAQKVRRVTYARGDKVKCGWLMRKEQLAEFRDWFDDSDGANGGQAWFQILIDTGGTTETVDARFSTDPQMDYAAPYWSVTATLEVG